MALPDSAARADPSVLRQWRTVRIRLQLFQVPLANAPLGRHRELALPNLAKLSQIGLKHKWLRMHVGDDEV